MNLKSWLRRLPAPAKVIADGNTVAVPDSPRRWAELEGTLIAMGASKIVCVAADGSTIRAVELDQDDDDERPAAAPRGGDSGSELQVMSRLLADAYANGMKCASEAFKGSIEENTKLVRLLADRLSAIEVAWQRSLATHARMTQDLAEARAAGAGGEDALIASLLPAMMQGEARGPVKAVK